MQELLPGRRAWASGAPRPVSALPNFRLPLAPLGPERDLPHGDQLATTALTPGRECDSGAG